MPKSLNIYLNYLLILIILIGLSFKSLDYINRDGVLYFIQANEYIIHGFEQSLNVYNWPFFAIILAELSLIFHLDFLATSKIINIVSYFFIFFFYYQVTKVVNNKINVFIPSAFFLSSLPLLNDYYGMFLRDPIALMFFVMSLLFFLKALKKCETVNSYKIIFGHLFIANIFLLLAIMFRIEYFLFFSLNLLLIFFIQFSNNSIKNFFVFTVCLFALIFLIGFVSLSLSPNNNTKLNEVFNRILFIINNLNYQINANTNDERLNKLLADYSFLSRLGFSSLIFIKKFIYILGLINIILLPFSIFTLIKRSCKVSNFLTIVLILILTYNFLYLFSHYELSGRYLLPALIIVYILNANFYSLYFHQNLIGLAFVNEINKKKLNILFFLLFFIFFISIFFDKQKINKDLEIAKIIMKEKSNYSECFISSIRVSYYLNILTFKGNLSDKIFNQFDCIILESKHVETYKWIIDRNFTQKNIYNYKNKPHIFILERKL